MQQKAMPEEAGKDLPASPSSAEDNNQPSSDPRKTDRRPICDYEGSDYQTRFWKKGGREYEDRSEAIALKRLLPKRGKLLLELGAGAGRNTARYEGFEKVVLLDYSRSQLRQAQDRLGNSQRYIYVAADIYRLPFVDGLFDATTMIRVLHHMADPRAALQQVHSVMEPGGVFILEYANKRNFKSILRFWLHKQVWDPFSPGPVELVPLNFDFHPRTIRKDLNDLGFQVEKILTLSHFRIELFKRNFPPAFLAWLDSLLQWSGSIGQYSPSVFLRASTKIAPNFHFRYHGIHEYFKCPDCGHSPLGLTTTIITCPGCQRTWNITDGIFDFRGDEE